MNVKKSSKPISGIPLIAFGLIAVFSFFSGMLGALIYSKNINPSTHESTLIVDKEGDVYRNIADKAAKSTVSIIVESQAYGYFSSYTQTGAGSGVVISKDGYILTNRHVVDGESSISVVMSDGSVYDDVEIVALDPRGGMDVAVLKILGVDDLVPADLGDSDLVQVGDRVVAVGYALGEYQNTVTTGIISGRSRPVTASDSTGYEALTDLLQTDAAINPGNSGGPLYNLAGEVIGINTAVADAENIGFAIPLSNIRVPLDGLIETGEYEVPYLGVAYVQLNGQIARELSLSLDAGAYLDADDSTTVVANSPAEKAGLQPGDIIKSINGRQLTQAFDLGTAIGRFRVGDKVTLEIDRDGQILSLETVLESAEDYF